ncbi:MAG: 4Fe-4S binding protein, partial [Hyphomicrobiaceae bacterium]
MTVPPHKETLLVCTCQRTMAIDGRRLAEALGAPHAFTIHTELCRGQTSTFADALAGGGPVHVACTQEAPLFREIAEEQTRGDVPLTFTNIRERAGWCKSDAVPKMAALLAEARHVSKPAGSTTLKSEGVCLVYGAGQTALDAAQRLAGRLSVTLLLADAAGVFPPSVAAVPVFTGRIRTAKG